MNDDLELLSKKIIHERNEKSQIKTFSHYTEKRFAVSLFVPYNLFTLKSTAKIRGDAEIMSLSAQS